MKKILPLFLLVALSSHLFSQAPTSSELFDFNKSRNQKTRKGLKVLGVWALANMGTSAYYYSTKTGVDKSFHQMNIMWNAGNTFIVAVSLLPKDRNDLNLAKTLSWQSNTEATYIASAALDIVYSTCGLYLTEKAKNDIDNHDKYQGWGNAIAYNGAFLFLFDTSMYIVHKRNGKKMSKMMDKITLSAGGAGLKLNCTF